MQEAHVTQKSKQVISNPRKEERSPEPCGPDLEGVWHHAVNQDPCSLRVARVARSQRAWGTGDGGRQPKLGERLALHVGKKS